MLCCPQHLHGQDMVEQGPPWLTGPLSEDNQLEAKRIGFFMDDPYNAGKVSTGVNIL